MNRVLLIILALFGGGGLLAASAIIPNKVTVTNPTDNTAALYRSVSQVSTSTEEDTAPEVDALTLPAGYKDASTESPMDTSHVGPSSRVSPGIPSATSTSALRIPVVVYHTLRPKQPGHGKHGENAYNVPPPAL